MSYKSRRSLASYLSKLDIRVLLVFVGLILAGLFIFMFQLYNHVDCSKVDFRIEAERKQVGETIEFKDITPEAKSWEWDFGDGSPKKFDRHPLHKYIKSGIYTITLEVNGSCKLHKTIEIKDLGQILDPLKVPKIVVPAVVTVGDPIEFNYVYNYQGEAFSWEWSFGETGQMDNTSEFPVYVYSVPGLKKITLVVNGDVPHIATKEIVVIPRKLTKKMRDSITQYIHKIDPNLYTLPKGDPKDDPLDEFLQYISVKPSELPKEIDHGKPVSQKVKSLSEAQIKKFIMDVAAQSKTSDDFVENSCGSKTFPVILNNDIILTFEEFCEGITNEKIKIEALRATRNDRNCVEGITVSLKTKKFIFWSKKVKK